jgi:hypothetical protein
MPLNYHLKVVKKVELNDPNKEVLENLRRRPLSRGLDETLKPLNRHS